MTDALFDLPEQQPDALEAARRRFAAADKAVDDYAMTANLPLFMVPQDMKDELVLARHELRLAESAAIAEAAELRRRGGRA